MYAGHPYGPPISLIFWLAIVAIVGINAWQRHSRERERQLTIRAALERGQQVDPALMEKLTARPPEKDQSPEQLLIGSIIVIAAGFGVMVLGWFISHLSEQAFWPIVGSGVLVAIIGCGMLLASVLQRRLRESAKPRDPGM